MPHELNVVARNMKSSTLGSYSDRTKTISVNRTSLLHGDSLDLLITICHEAYHAYEYHLIDIYINASASSDEQKDSTVYRKAQKYHEEFLYYISGGENFYSYYNQDCEKDARHYAESAVSDYHSKICDYINKNNKES